jgi:short/branched chain acyl-CoA dehydrogenase
MGALGLFGLLVPEDRGGSAADFTTFCTAIEELAAVDSSMAITLSAGVGLGIGPIMAFGSDAQHRRWLPDLAAGRALGAFGLTEASSGSDAGSLRTRAVLDDDEWVIDGSKEFITNSGTPMTSVITVAARTDDGTSAFLVPCRHAGSHRGAAVQEDGVACLRHPWPHLRRVPRAACRVPRENLLGDAGRGFQQFLTILDGGRVAIAALAVGLARACLERCVTYANERNAFGGPLRGSRASASRWPTSPLRWRRRGEQGSLLQ